MKKFFQNKMRVAIVAGRDPEYKNDTDGGAIFLKNFARELARRGICVDVFTPLQVSGGVFDAQKIITTSQVSASNSPHIYRFPVSVPNDTRENITPEDYFINRLALSREIARFFEKGQLFTYDAVYILHIANAFGIMAGNLSPTHKTILFPMMTSPYYELFSRVPEIYIENEKKTFETIKHISSPSADEMKTMLDFYRVPPEKIFKTHRGYDPVTFHVRERSGLHEERTIHLFSANGIRPQKNHLFFIPLVKLLAQQFIDVHVHLTGNNGHSHNETYNEYAKNFWRLVEENGLQGAFTSYGVVSDKELVRIMGSSDVAVYPSISETFGKSALESMATGLPTIVGDNLPAYEEFIESNVTGAIARLQPEYFAEEIVRMIKEPERYHAISRNGIERGREFTWEKVIDDFLDTQRKRGIF